MKSLVIILILLMGAVPLTAVAEEDVGFTITMSIRFYQCVAPEDVHCMVTSETNKANCPECRMWLEKFGPDTAEVKFEISAYAYDTSPGFERANYFLSDAARKVYDVEYPKTEQGYPVTIRDFYKNHEKYGWIELDKSSATSKAGALLVWENIGGLVINYNAVLTETDDEFALLYPSHIKHGELITTSQPWALGDEQKAKYLVPAGSRF